MTLWRCQAWATDAVDTQKTPGRIIGLASSWRFRSCWCGPPDDPGSRPDADRQAPGDEEGDRRPGTSAGRDHAPHLGRLNSARPGRPWQHESRTKSNITGEHSSSTAWWNDVVCGTMDEVSSYVCLEPAVGLTVTPPTDSSTSSSNLTMEGPWCRFRREARARERHQHRSGG
jgi:hypothetical protein